MKILGTVPEHRNRGLTALSVHLLTVTATLLPKVVTIKSAFLKEMLIVAVVSGDL